MKVFYESRSDSDSFELFVGQICDHPFPPHVHGIVEIVNLYRGSVRMLIGDTEYELHAGDTIAIFPSIVHSYEAVSEDADGLCVMFVPDIIAEFTQLFRGMRPITPLLNSSVFTQDFTESLKALQKLSSDLRSPLIKAYLHVYLAHLMLYLELAPLEKRIDTSLTQQVIQYVSEHFDEQLSLEYLSGQLNVSQSFLSHLFSEQLKINFRKYVNSLRIGHACTLLRDTDMTITEICYACGYSNSRTFHRAFIDERGMQPGEFRAQIRNRST